MRSLDICSTARRAGLSEFGPIKYRTGDSWQHNVMLWCGNWWSCDCLGFVHTMVNGFVGDRSKLGGGAVMDSFVTNADEWTTLNSYCYDVSGNFSNLVPCELLYMSGHVGLYIGDCEPFGDGRIFNVAECCYSSFGGGGMLTYVDRDGARLNHKNGSGAGYWVKHGKFYRVDYTDQEEPQPEPEPEITPADVLDIANDVFIGVYGNNPQREQKLTELYGREVYRKVQDIMNILYR